MGDTREKRAIDVGSGLAAPRAVGLGRVLGAVLLLAMAAIHVLGWFDGYGSVPVIGPAFLVNAVGGVVLAVAVLVAPARHLALTGLLGAVFTAGTLLALVLSLTVGLFGFVDGLGSLEAVTLVVEAIGVVVLLGVAQGARRAHRAG